MYQIKFENGKYIVTKGDKPLKKLCKFTIKRTWNLTQKKRRNNVLKSYMKLCKQVATKNILRGFNMYHVICGNCDIKDLDNYRQVKIYTLSARLSLRLMLKIG